MRFNKNTKVQFGGNYLGDVKVINQSH